MLTKPRILFITGTRADFGKLKPLMLAVSRSNNMVQDTFITGMHMMKLYGSTHHEVAKADLENVHKYINQFNETPMDCILANTVKGLARYVYETEPDMLVAHGDRVEALAAAIVGATRNILVIHIEGGELSGTVDESIRHCITKLSHIHFVANEQAKKRLLQMGEAEENVHIIGSPDIDIMLSNDLPELSQVKKHYNFDFDKYAIAIFHPVTTEIEQLESHVNEFVNALLASEKNYIVIYPNNDTGSSIILRHYVKLKNHSRFHLYPSIGFERFLTLLKNAEFIIGNSSSGIREAPYYNVPTINIGTRQNKRAQFYTILNCDYASSSIIKAIEATPKIEKTKDTSFNHFGDGNSTNSFLNLLNDPKLWQSSTQKIFYDR